MLCSPEHQDVVQAGDAPPGFHPSPPAWSIPWGLCAGAQTPQTGVWPQEELDLRVGGCDSQAVGLDGALADQ